MARYGVIYWESYSRYYEVEANSAEESVTENFRRRMIAMIPDMMRKKSRRNK